MCPCLSAYVRRLRKLVENLDDGKMDEVYLFPKAFESTVTSKVVDGVDAVNPDAVASGSDASEGAAEAATEHTTYTATYYIGLEVNKLRYAAGTIDLTATLSMFKNMTLPERFDPAQYADISKLGFADATLTWDALPDSVRGGCCQRIGSESPFVSCSVCYCSLLPCPACRSVT